MEVHLKLFSKMYPIYSKVEFRAYIVIPLYSRDNDLKKLKFTPPGNDYVHLRFDFSLMVPRELKNPTNR